MRTLLLSALALLPAPALAQPAPSPSPTPPPAAREPVRTPPSWRRQPTPEELLAVFPRDNNTAFAGGRATIVCTVTVQGALRDCRTASESPAGAGFGQAALALAPQFNFNPATVDGRPVEAEVRVPLRWPACGQCAFDPAPTDTLLSNIPWSRAPTYAQMQAAYPPRARERREGGRATIECTFRQEGDVHRCRIVSEAPRGSGFGNAAVALARLFRTEPTPLPGGRRLAGSRTMLTFSFPVEALGDAPPVIEQPVWLEGPTREQATASYPAAALADGTGGRVVVLCLIADEGRVSGCQIESETPAGLGFGAASVHLAGHFQMSVWTADGLPTVGSRVRIPITWRPRPPPPAETPTPAGPSGP